MLFSLRVNYEPMLWCYTYAVIVGIVLVLVLVLVLEATVLETSLVYIPYIPPPPVATPLEPTPHTLSVQY